MGDYTVIIDPFVAPVLVGDARQVVKNNWSVASSPFGKITIEQYQLAAGQPLVAQAFMNDMLLLETCMDVERINQCGDTTIINTTWAYDRDNPSWVAGSDIPLWDFDVIDTSVALARHPYFGGNTALSATDRDVLMKELGACDQSMSLGQPYSVQDNSASDLVQAIIARYAGLRAAGVEEWNPIMVMVSKRFRVFPSQSPALRALLANINRTILLASYNPPSFVTDALAGLTTWTYSGGDGSPIPIATTNTFSFVRMKPVVKLSGNNPNGPYDVTEYFLGLQESSAVLYPPVDGAPAGWDPQYDIWKNFEE